MANDNSQNSEQTDAELLPKTRPRVFFKSITFQDSTEIKLGNNDIVVFIGGNNAGKSQTLKDLDISLTGEGANKSILKVELGISGSAQSLLNFIRDNSFFKKEEQGGNIVDRYKNYGFDISFFQGQFEQSIQQQWDSKRFGTLKGLFCRRIKTETRIIDSNQANSFPARREAPSNAIQFLFKNALDAKRVSDYFKEAFGKELIVDRGALSEIPLLVGKDIIPSEGELLTDESYGKRLYKNALLLAEQGDGMRSFASVILQTLAYKVLSIILLDEPEAFLHPPQAKILGRILAKERPRDTQLFIATHSVDILMGLLEARPDNLRIIRLSREGGRKSVVELNKDRISEIMRNPLLRYSNVLSGAFYKRAIICEDSSDCLFYQSLLGAMGEPVSDALFLYTNGKDRLNQLAEILKALGVPVSVIADIDILRGEKNLKDIITALRGDWGLARETRDSLEKAIEQEYSSKSPKVICTELGEGLTKLNSQKDFTSKDIKAFCAETLKKASPWPMLKRAGNKALPKGDARALWNKLWRFCAENKLWIVPTGEIESFSDEGGHGPNWVEKVLEQGDLETRSDLREARKFIAAVWGNDPDKLN